MSMQPTTTADLPLTLGRQLAEARKRTGESQKQLGDRWNLHRTTISRYERDDIEGLSFAHAVDLSDRSGWPLELFARAMRHQGGGPDDTGGQRLSPTRWSHGHVIDIETRRSKTPLRAA